MIPYIEIDSTDNWYQWDEVYVNIIDITENYIRFDFYHQKGGVHLSFYDTCTGTIEGNTVIGYTNTNKGGPPLDKFKITLLV